MSTSPPPDDNQEHDDDGSLSLPARADVVDPLDTQGPLRLPAPVPAPPPVQLPHREGSGHRRRRKPLERKVVLTVAGCALAGGIGAALTSAHPTGGSAVDTLLCFGFAVAVVLAASVARRWTWLVLAGTAALLAGPAAAKVLALVALGVAFHGAAFAKRRGRSAGAVVGALSMQALLRSVHVGFHGATALVVGAVTLAVLVSGYRASRRHTRRNLRWAVRIAAVLVAVAVAGVSAAMLMARSSLSDAVSESRAGLDAALAGHQTEAADQWALAAKSFRKANDALEQPWARAADLVPIVAQHARAVRSASASGVEISTTATLAARTAPYRELRSRNGRVNIALVRRMQRPVGDTQAALERASASLAKLDTSWLVPMLNKPLGEYRTELHRALPEATIAHDALVAAPGLLGGNGTRRYLVLFSTPAESRYLGGFIGSWAELTATNGKLKLTRHGRIGELDTATPDTSRSLKGMDGYLSRYGQFQPARFIQNVTASPDFPTVDKAVSQLYPQAGGQHLDGTIYADPYALAAMLKITGPVAVEGLPYPLTSANAAKFLLHDQYTTFNGINERTDFLSAASTATFDALTTQSLPTVPRITDALSPMVRQHRLLFTSHVASENAFLGRIGLVGALPEAGGKDYFALRTSNANPSKIDYYLHRSVIYKADYDPRTGFVDATATIRLTNTAPASGLPDYVIGNDDLTSGKVGGRPRGSNYTWLSVYSALGSPSATLDGRPQPLEVESELGHQVYSAFVLVPAGSAVTLRLHLSGKVARNNDYRLLLPYQPLVNTDHLKIVVTSATDRAEVDPDRAKASGGVATVPVTLERNRTVSVPFRAR